MLRGRRGLRSGRPGRSAAGCVRGAQLHPVPRASGCRLRMPGAPHATPEHPQRPLLLVGCGGAPAGRRLLRLAAAAARYCASPQHGTQLKHPAKHRTRSDGGPQKARRRRADGLGWWEQQPGSGVPCEEKWPVHSVSLINPAPRLQSLRLRARLSLPVACSAPPPCAAARSTPTGACMLLADRAAPPQQGGICTEAPHHRQPPPRKCRWLPCAGLRLGRAPWCCGPRPARRRCAPAPPACSSSPGLHSLLGGVARRPPSPPPRANFQAPQRSPACGSRGDAGASRGPRPGRVGG